MSIKIIKDQGGPRRKLRMRAGGQSLFELVFTVAILAFFLIALIGAVARSISVSVFSKQKSEANNYTQEALEWLRRERDLDFQDFYSKASISGSLYCINDLSFVSGSCSGKIDGTLFAREVTLTSDEVGKMEVSVRVYWTGATGYHESKSDIIFTDWKNQ